MDDLTGKVALVTGAGSGLGEATARAFAKAGVAVACTDLNREAVERVLDCIRGAYGVDGCACVCDVSKADNADAAVKTAVDKLQGLDFLINCAAIDYTFPFEELSVEQWDREIAVNLRGPFLMSKAAVPVMKSRRSGHIVNIASTAGVRAWSGASAYHASKWGVIGFSRALGVDCRPYNIRVTTIIPGGMRTHFFDRFAEQGIPLPDEKDLQDPANVAEMILCAARMPAESAVQEVIVTPINEPSWP